MASMMFIHDHEDKIMKQCMNVVSVVQAYTTEKSQGDGELIPENRDSWGTLHVNLLVLQKRIDKLLSVMEEDFA